MTSNDEKFMEELDAWAKSVARRLPWRQRIRRGANMLFARLYARYVDTCLYSAFLFLGLMFRVFARCLTERIGFDLSLNYELYLKQERTKAREKETRKNMEKLRAEVRDMISKHKRTIDGLACNGDLLSKARDTIGPNCMDDPNSPEDE